MSDYLNLSQVAREYIDARWPESDVKVTGDHIVIKHAHGFFSGFVDDIEKFAAAADAAALEDNAL